jgi:hypothetical protein
MRFGACGAQNARNTTTDSAPQGPNVRLQRFLRFCARGGVALPRYSRFPV